MPGCMKHKLESSLLGEISITSDTQIISVFLANVNSAAMNIHVQVFEYVVSFGLYWLYT